MDYFEAIKYELKVQSTLKIAYAQGSPVKATQALSSVIKQKERMPMIAQSTETKQKDKTAKALSTLDRRILKA
jgi:hypothetical protein